MSSAVERRQVASGKEKDKDKLASSRSKDDVSVGGGAAGGGCGEHTCTVCLERIGASRGMAHLMCGHQFHLDCIGSAFNVKGSMECPNCRHVENGMWLYGVGSLGTNMDELEYDQDYEEETFAADDDGDFPVSAGAASPPTTSDFWCEQCLTEDERCCACMCVAGYSMHTRSADNEGNSSANEDEDDEMMRAYHEAYSGMHGAAYGENAFRTPPRTYHGAAAGPSSMHEQLHQRRSLFNAPMPWGPFAPMPNAACAWSQDFRGSWEPGEYLQPWATGVPAPQHMEGPSSSHPYMPHARRHRHRGHHEPTVDTSQTPPSSQARRATRGDEALGREAEALAAAAQILLRDRLRTSGSQDQAPELTARRHLPVNPRQRTLDDVSYLLAEQLQETLVLPPPALGPRITSSTEGYQHRCPYCHGGSERRTRRFVDFEALRQHVLAVHQVDLRSAAT
eukprot:jgi/Chlat1/1414/Chrsp12S01979